MTVTAIVGAQWGDEGKGRIVDALAGEMEWVIRFQGGDHLWRGGWREDAGAGLHHW